MGDGMIRRFSSRALSVAFHPVINRFGGPHPARCRLAMEAHDRSHDHGFDLCGLRSTREHSASQMHHTPEPPVKVLCGLKCAMGST